MNHPETASGWRRQATTHALAFGLLVCFILVLSDQLSMEFGLQSSQRVVDDLVGGIIAGLLVFWFERARSRSLLQRWQTIRLMNHHVRNALQVIAYSAHMPPDPERIRQMADAVKRIEWALREVLPGEVSDYDISWKDEAAPVAEAPSPNPNSRKTQPF